jgi:GGDEF domain-containing protein
LVGRSKFVELTFVAQLDEKGALEGYCLTARDATETALREQTLLLAARRDPLTGLCNQTSFTERLEQALGNVDSEASVLAIATLDVDGFRHFNERFGHEGGDQILRNSANASKPPLGRLILLHG